MRTLCFYISDYGYGHATRSIAIIRELLGSSVSDLKVIVCGGKVLPFVRQSLQPFEDVRYREVDGDLGYVLQKDGLEPDLERFSDAYDRYVSRMPALAERESRFLREQFVSLVLTDISPIPILAAHQCAIPSVGISNFTWYTAYASMLSSARLRPLFDAYAKMSRFIRLQGAAEPDWGEDEEGQAAFFCRQPDPEAVDALRKAHNPDSSKRIVFFALGMSIETPDLDRMPLWQDESILFIVSSSTRLRRPNVLAIPWTETETQNYVAIADVVITKPGWGTVGEAVCLGKPLLLIERQGFNEDRNTIAALDAIKHPRALVKWEALLRMPLSSSDALFAQADRCRLRLTDANESLRRIGVRIRKLINQAGVVNS